MAKTDVEDSVLEFDALDLWDSLEALRGEPQRYDSLAFGLIAMDCDGIVFAYNRAESMFAGVSAQRAIGLVFFIDIAPCTNNYLVAGRFEESSQLDESIDYVFTVKMRPTRVRLRMLKDEGTNRQYLAVRWS